MTRPSPLVGVLAALTVVSGLVDAISFLGIAHVFTAIMTGNIVILGFALGGAEGFSVTATLVSLTAFLLGAAFGGRLSVLVADRRRRVIIAMSLEAGLLAIAGLGAVALDVSTASAAHLLIAVLGLAMGMRNAVVLQLDIPEAGTTVLTGFVAGLAADSPLGTGRNTRVAIRFTRIVGLLAGAVLGTLVLRTLGLFAAISAAVAAVVLIVLVYALHPGSRRIPGSI